MDIQALCLSPAKSCSQHCSSLACWLQSRICGNAINLQPDADWYSFGGEVEQ